MNPYVLSVIVENEPGILSRVAGLFSRRGYNIKSLSVGETEDPKISRMTIVVTGDRQIVEQIKKQLQKLIDVVKIYELEPEASVYRELALVKVMVNEQNRPSILEVVEIFRGKVIDIATESLTVELTGDHDKINAFVDMMKVYGISEMARTGLTGLARFNG
ncbi:acetolactate synthase small subunit [Fusibacter ferrireducens]|uniref:Acetolactate synthase small subunit n=1 Tax=Fusibacter ferrireducens TaxID=2785058 RepID=A0ABR9ZUY2_9FIRM|nr:acetolactate synthase small subunit [Fusibacter ferrireducens]MBF4694273.1 acetolactate synthase small subunit [Fusibacter ferrireducens]